MPTTRSNQRIAQINSATNFAKRLDDARQISGAAQFAFIDVPIAADNATGNIIELIELPAGAIVLPELSKIVVDDDFAAAATVNIGDVADRDRYAAAVPVNDPGIFEFWRTSPVLAGFTTRHECVDTGVAATTTTLITLEIASITTASSGTLRVVLAYKCL